MRIIMIIIVTKNAWQSLAYSPLGAEVSPPSEYLWTTLTYWSPEFLTAPPHSKHRWTKHGNNYQNCNIPILFETPICQINKNRELSVELQQNFHFLPHFNSKTTKPIFTNVLHDIEQLVELLMHHPQGDCALRFRTAALQKRNASISKRYGNARKSLRKHIRIMYELSLIHISEPTRPY